MAVTCLRIARTGPALPSRRRALKAIDNSVCLVDFGGLQHGPRLLARGFSCAHARPQRQAVPDVSLVGVLRDAAPDRVEVTELELCCSVAPAGRFAVPLCGSCIVSSEAAAGRVHVTKPLLCQGVAGVGEGLVHPARALVVAICLGSAGGFEQRRCSRFRFCWFHFGWLGLGDCVRWRRHGWRWIADRILLELLWLIHHGWDRRRLGSNRRG